MEREARTVEPATISPLDTSTAAIRNINRLTKAPGHPLKTGKAPCRFAETRQKAYSTSRDNLSASAFYPLTSWTTVTAMAFRLQFNKEEKFTVCKYRAKVTSETSSGRSSRRTSKTEVEYFKVFANTEAVD